MRAVRVSLVSMVIVAVLGTAATAQAPVPTVAVTVGKGSITLSPAGTIGAGPTRFEVTRSSGSEAEMYLATLRAGVTVDELRQTLSASTERALGLVFLEASVADPGARNAVTVDLRQNTTYVALSIQGRSFETSTFTTGSPNGASAPAPDARVRMVDYGFGGSKTLPRNGRIRVTNAGFAYHFALAFRLRSGVGIKQVGRAFGGGGGGDRLIGRTVAGPPLEVQGLISPLTTNDNEVRFPRRGRYAFVCFFGEHNRLGMYKIFRVR